MFSNIIKRVILYLIRIIEYFEYKHLSLDEEDNSKKILNSQILDNYEVLTDTGFKPITHIHKTQPYQIWKIVTENGFTLEGADNHIIFSSDLKEVCIKDTHIGLEVMTIEGPSKISSITTSNISISMYDLTVNSEDHRYYTNGILSHNTVITSIYLVWYLLFNFDRNVLLIANKGATVKEILEKIKSILEHLPFFLKPGILEKNVMKMKFDNGCRILGQATTKTASIGFTIHLLYSDEFAHIPANILNHLWKSMYPTLSSSKVAQIIITSTPNGYNLFQNIYQNSVDGLNTFHNIFVPWWFVKGRDDAWKKKEIANLGSEEAFNQEYGCQFLSSADLLLSAKHFQYLDSCKKPYSSINGLEGIPIEGKEQFFEFLDIPLVNHDNLLYEHISNNPYILLTIDTSEGVGGDYSVINFWFLELMTIQEARKFAKYNKVTSPNDFVKLKQFGIYHDNNISPDKFTKLVYWLGTECLDIETTRICIEYNTFGGEVCRGLYNLYGEYNEWPEGIILRYSHRQNTKTKHEGLKLNSDNKRTLCNTTKRLIDEEKLEITYSNTITQAQFFSRNKKGSYEATTGHDDEFMTVVHASSVFENMDFIDMLDDYFDINQEILEGYEDLLDILTDEQEGEYIDFFDTSGMDLDEDGWM